MDDEDSLRHDTLASSGCAFIGYWPNEGYEFNQSKASTADKTQFVGLSLDDENQYSVTD